MANSRVFDLETANHIASLELDLCDLTEQVRILKIEKTVLMWVIGLSLLSIACYVKAMKVTEQKYGHAMINAGVYSCQCD